MNSLLRSLFVLVFVSGCASAPATRPEAKPESEATEKPASEAASAKPAPAATNVLAREVAALPLKDVPFADGTFTGQVESSGQPKATEHEGFTHVEIPIGTASDVSCFVYPKFLDSGAALMGFVGSVTEKVQVAQLRTTEIVPAGVNAVVVVHANYIAEAEGGGKQQGILKVAVRAANGNSLLCFHDEPGYSKSFSRVVQSFAKTLEPADEEYEEPRYAELQVVKFRDVPVGFERRRMLDANTGGRMDEVVSMMLMPRSATELVSQDGSQVTVTDKTGRVESIRIAEASGGEAAVDMSVKRGAKKNQYTYEGTMSGKEVQGTFKSTHKDGLPGDELLEKFMKTKMFDGKTTTYSHEQYDPEIDLAKPMELKITRREAPRTVNVSYGAISIEGTIDDNGLMEKGQVTMGPASMSVERVASQGKP